MLQIIGCLVWSVSVKLHTSSSTLVDSIAKRSWGLDVLNFVRSEFDFEDSQGFFWPIDFTAKVATKYN